MSLLVPDRRLIGYSLTRLGRVLVNEYTRSAAEMIAAFARNEGIAQVVGTRTPGEVLGAANFHVGADCHLRIPVTAWYTAKDQLIEGGGVEPDTEQANTIESLLSRRDLPMEKAQSVLQAS
jgi:C-terminal processing protease CtpA/Prc